MPFLFFPLQIKLYAKYSDYRDIELGDNALEQAECYNELDKNYIDSINVYVFMSYVLCLPIFFIILLIMVVRSLSNAITTKLSSSLNHPTVTGMVLTGVFVHFCCLSLDMMAIYYMHHDEELRDNEPHVDVRKKLNFFTTAITLTFNLIVTLMIVLCLVYLQCQHIGAVNASRCLKLSFQCILSPCFYVIFGRFDVEEFWKGVSGNDETQKRKYFAWIVCFMLLAPLFSFSSHLGYIFVAWLTKPTLALSVALMLLGVCLYLFFMFRQCYMVNKDIDNADNKCGNCLLVLYYPIYQCGLLLVNIFCVCIRKKTYPSSKYQPLNGSRRKVSQIFDTKAFCVSFAWGVPLVGTVAFLLAAFYKLPIASYLLPVYLLNAFQVFIVVITLLITYKVLQFTEPEIRAFMKSMKRAYNSRANRRNVNPAEKVSVGEDEVEATGLLVGELVEVVIHELRKKKAAVSGQAGGAGGAAGGRQ